MSLPSPLPDVFRMGGPEPLTIPPAQSYYDRLTELRKSYPRAGDLTLTDMQRLLNDVTYRPNAQLRLVEVTPVGDVALVIELKVQDTYSPGHEVRVMHRYAVPPMMSGPEHFIAFLRVCIERTEVHEAMEWFKWRHTGRPIFDPHAQD